uniref:Type III effector HopAU1 n=1 Tax=Ganoderma boninense TaxID=34458 RepID=A0A5K1K768_9APHY|nr:Type III effector HopAU1 [Ganoderma boninense]
MYCPQITFSDLSGGYETVRREYDAPPPPLEATDDVIPTASEGRLGAATLRTYEIMDDPNSMAVFVVKPSLPARIDNREYEASVMVSHRKLRTLFKNAIDWYLRSKGLDPNQPRFYRLAQIDQSNRSRANVQWRYMTFHLPDDFNTRAPLTRLLDRMDQNYIQRFWAFVTRQLFLTGLAFFALFVVLFLLLA